jgi:glycosyltransferase involved in cell wall biosynthesis
MNENNKPLITIAMACYNSEKFIIQAIKSIFRQNYKNWELIIVDDHSKDRSYKIVENLIKKSAFTDKIKIFKHDKNYGYGRTLKDAIENGTGELIAIVDSDDALASKDALKIMVEKHINNPNASLVYSNYLICDYKLIPMKRAPSRQLKDNEIYLKTKIRISHLKVIKRSYYNKTDGVDATLLKCIDKDLVLKLEEVGKLIYVDKCLYLYRRHKNNLTNSLSKTICVNMRKIIYQNAKKRRGII